MLGKKRGNRLSWTVSMAEQTNLSPKASADFYRLLCEHAAVAMIATDANFTVVTCNAMAGELLGIRGEELIGRSILQAVPENRRKLFDKLLQRTTVRRQTSEFEVALPDGSGLMRNLLVILSPVPGPSGESLGVAAWVVNETNRRKSSERLAQAEKMASLGTLAGGVAHHFNNILGGVATFVDFALTSGDTVTMKRALQMTAEATVRASKITQSLISFAESEGAKSDLADLTEVVLIFMHLVERPLAGRKIEIHADLHPVPIIEVQTNRMHQVLANLLSNAEDAMPNGGKITIAIDRAGSDVVVTFADTGTGIKPEHLPLIFEPFFTTKGLLAGGNEANPGLGLSIVHGIILDMRGTIEAQSTVGQGTTFTIRLPIRGQNT